MPDFRTLVTTHKAVLFLAVLTSLTVAFPQLFFRFDQAEVYQGIELLPDSPWSARVREVQDGHPHFGSIYYQDGKDDPYLFQPLGSMVVAYMGQALSLNINNTILLSRLILPFLTVLLLYGFVFALSRDRLAALMSAALLLLADSILSFSGLYRIVQGLSPESFLRLARPVNPAMIYILLFGFLLAFWFFYRRRDWRYGVISAIVLGLNFYNYFYSWTYLYAFGGLLVLFFLIQKKWHEAARLSLVFVGALLVAIPYILNLHQAVVHPGYLETSGRFGVILTYAPIFVGWVAVVGLVIFLLGFPREDKEKHLFGLALLLAPFITLNQQIITGKALQAAHYHWFFHKPLAVIFILIILLSLLRRPMFLPYRKLVGVGLLLMSVTTGVFVQAASYLYDQHDGGAIAIERQKYGPVMEWLNQEARPEEMVLANDELSHLTVIYTPLNVFYHRAAVYSLSATPERLRDVLFTFYRLRGVGRTDAREVFFSERGHISANIYGIHYREARGSYEAIPDEKIEELIALYQTSLSVPTTAWFKQMRDKYHLVYLIWDKKSDPAWDLDRYSWLKLRAAFPDLALYQFVP